MLNYIGKDKLLVKCFFLTQKFFQSNKIMRICFVYCLKKIFVQINKLNLFKSISIIYLVFTSSPTKRYYDF